MNTETNTKTWGEEPFDPKRHPAVYQSGCSIRAFGIEFSSRHGVLAELRLMIGVVETWLPRGLFWHITGIAFDSKGGGVLVSLKERSDPMVVTAKSIASILKIHFGERCTTVSVEDHAGQLLAEAKP